MKHSVLLVGLLVLAAGLASGCGKVPDKTDLAQACMKRMGGVQQKCDCYVASIEKALTPEQFTQLAKGAYDNRDTLGSDWLPSNVASTPAINSALNAATSTCMSSA